MFYHAARSLLFRLDAERAHEVVTARMVGAGRSSVLLGLARSLYGTPADPRTVWGLRFPNRFGIAAGFDKNAQMIPMLAALGFGFIEVGTVTLEPQEGNPRPRLFRDPAAGAVINRLGFNSEGSVAVAARLSALWKEENSLRALPPVLVNIGKNRDVPLEAAVQAYAECYRRLAPLADGVVVNVSSPNTPGLRELQHGESLREILLALRAAREAIVPRRGGSRPIIVKIAPDLSEEEIAQVSGVCLELADGMSATNTTLSREGWTAAPQAGGLSGRPLLRRSNEVVAEVRRVVGPDYPLIGVGGIFSARDAKSKLEAGADLVQAYTGFIYEGPAFPSRVVRGLMKVEQ